MWNELQALTPRQQEIFDFILNAIMVDGAPPTRVEIAAHFGFKSANAAEDHLKALQKKGYVELKSGTSRGIFVSEEARNAWQLDHHDPELGMNSDIPSLAVIGDVAAGAPIFASQHIQQYISVDQSLFADKADYLLKVRGDSMINIGIFEHDLLAIKRTDSARDDEIVVARIDDDVTVKRFKRNPGASVSLIAENEDYDPIEVNLQHQSFAIEGVVVGLIRQDF
ncbi:MAG: transcriptional repressor LexA [Pseudomonadota bacterium]